MLEMPLPLAVALMPLPLAAHDFRIDLPSYDVAPDSRVPVRFLIGDIGAVEPWEELWRRVVSLRTYGPERVIDFTGGIA